MSGEQEWPAAAMEDVSLMSDEDNGGPARVQKAPLQPPPSSQAGPQRIIGGVPLLPTPAQFQANPPPTLEVNHHQFGDFHSADAPSMTDTANVPTFNHSRVPPPQPPQPPQADESLPKNTLPPLSAILDEEQKIAFAALCLLTFTQLKDRYARFEYIELEKPVATGSSSSSALVMDPIPAKNTSRPGSGLASFFRRPVQDEKPLLKNDADKLSKTKETGVVGEQFVLDEDVPLTSATGQISPNARLAEQPHEPSPSSKKHDLPAASIPKSSSHSSFHGSIDELARQQGKRVPFANLMNIQENIEDLVYFGKEIDGNVALCYAIRTYDIWAQRIMDRIYAELKITPKERVFIEQTIVMGMHPDDLTKCLIPKTPLFAAPPTATSDTPSRSGTSTPTGRPSIHNDLKFPPKDDVRPYILWNLIILLLTSEQDRYDSRARMFFRRIAVDLLRYGSWIDCMEEIEIPITTASLQHATAKENPSSVEPSPFTPTIRHSIQHLASSSNAGGTRVFGAQDSNMDSITSSKSSLILKNNELEKMASKERRKRAAYMAAAAVGGGVIIGVSAGLAAPVLGRIATLVVMIFTPKFIGAGIGALLTAVKITGTTGFLTGVGGTALITSGGVLAGSSLAGSKMATRTAGIEVFRFIPINENQRNNLVISVSGWLTSKKKKSATVLKPNADPTRQRTASSVSSVSVATSSSAESKGKDADAATIGSVESSTQSATAGSEKDKDDVDVDEYLATGLDDLVVPFMGVSPIMGSHYALCYDPHILSRLGDALNIFASEIVSFSAQQILQQTVLATVLSALAWPMWLVKLGYLVDNPWSLGLDRSRKAGLILAEALINNVQSGRPVTLVGFSLGAKAIWHCLVELGQRGKYGIVEDVYIFGAPLLIPRISTSTATTGAAAPASATLPKQKGKSTETSPQHMKSLDEWRQAISVVSGTFVNCFSRVDWVLGYMFRGSVAGMYDVAGLGPVILDEEEMDDVEVLEVDELEPQERPDDPDSVAYKNLSEEDKEKKLREKPRSIRNVDITALVPGHLYYRDAMPMLVKRVCGFACWTEQVEVIEEIVAGEWMEDIDGWWKTEQERLQTEKKRKWRRKKAAKAAKSSMPADSDPSSKPADSSTETETTKPAAATESAVVSEKEGPGV